VFLPACLTCNNIKISGTIKEMKDSYIDWKNSLNRKIRKFKREKHGKKLGKHEIQEEEYEHLEFNMSFKNDDNKDKEYFTILEKDMHIGEIDLLINSLNVEIMMNLIRNEINQGDAISKKYKKNYTQLLTQTT